MAEGGGEPLARRPGESRRANAALRDYALSGAGRSIRGLVDGYVARKASGEQAAPPTTQRSTAFGWSLKFEWQARVDAFERRKAFEEEIEWSRRRREIREADYLTARRLRERAMEILERSVTEADWRYVDAARMVEVASKLARLSAEMESLASLEIPISVIEVGG